MTPRTPVATHAKIIEAKTCISHYHNNSYKYLVESWCRGVVRAVSGHGVRSVRAARGRGAPWAWTGAVRRGARLDGAGMARSTRRILPPFFVS